MTVPAGTHPKLSDLSVGCTVYRRSDGMQGTVTYLSSLTATQKFTSTRASLRVRWADSDADSPTLIRLVRLTPKKGAHG